MNCQIAMFAQLRQHIRRSIDSTIVVLIVSLGIVFLDQGASADDEVKSLVQGYNRSGLEVFETVAGGSGNLVLSPYSIGTAMAMTMPGARGETQAEMVRILKVGVSPAAIASVHQRVNARLMTSPVREDVKISVANALYLTTHRELVADPYRQLLSENFGAEVFGGSDLESVNEWVKQETDGRIEQILSRLDPNSVGILLNAIYFKGTWAFPFNKRATSLGRFHLSRDDSAEVPMMHRTGRYRNLRNSAFRAVALPYSGSEVLMIILVPVHLAGPGEAAIGLTDRSIEGVIENLDRTEPEEIALSMPRFKTEFTVDLVPAFVDLGMTLAFDEDRADFAGITENRNGIHISQIQHKALIEANEAGTEAAAATAVEVSKRSVRPAIFSFLIDRPFLYLIIHKPTGAILFVGRLSDPRE
jgi:serpin B